MARQRARAAARPRALAARGRRRDPSGARRAPSGHQGAAAIASGAGATDLSGAGERRGGKLEGGGAGGTMVVAPRAFVVIGADGVPQLIALKDGKYGQLQPAIALEAHKEEPSKEPNGK